MLTITFFVNFANPCFHTVRYLLQSWINSNYNSYDSWSLGKS